MITYKRVRNEYSGAQRVKYLVGASLGKRRRRKPSIDAGIGPICDSLLAVVALDKVDAVQMKYVEHNYRNYHDRHSIAISITALVSLVEELTRK